jgi:spermidine synthase/MFS family permease
MKIPTLWKAVIIAFASSFCVMVIELVAARILAPQIGVSLYTWTSIIGVILAGIALGNYLGGKIADKWASPSLLVTILLAGTLATMAILPISKATVAVNWFMGIHLMLDSILRVITIFFLPAIILSMVSPLVIKLTLADLGKTGGVVGTIYAFSTVGAILGTFMTGFFFVLWFGTRMTVWLVVAVLILTALIAWVTWKIPQRWKISIRNVVLVVLAVLIILSAILLFTFRYSWEPNYTRETNYYTIQITQGSTSDPVTDKQRVLKSLILDHLVHSFVVPDDPNYLGYGYLRIFAELIKYRVGDNSAPNILYLGGGGYGLPRYIDANYPGSTNEVVEIDPGVTQIAYQELGLPLDTRIITYNQDARMFFNNHNDLNGKYDVVIGDVYNDMSIPYHLTTLEFAKIVKASLNPDGMYLVNIIDQYYVGKFLSTFINTLNHAFKHVYLISDKDFYEYVFRNTFVLVATDSPLNVDDFKASITSNTDRWLGLIIHDEALLEEYLADRNPILLTDDYAPTDSLVAPLYKRQ